MAYADHEYYTSVFGGSAVSSEDFPRLAARASAYIDYYTLGRAAQEPELDGVKAACCALAEQYQTIEICERAAKQSASKAEKDACGEGGIKSETVGSYSVTRQTGAEAAASAAKLAAEAKQTLSDTARMYLIGTGLLYRGGRCPACMRRIL